MLGNIDTCDLSDGELRNCYEAAWKITGAWCAKRAENARYAAGRKEVQKAINDHLGLLDQVMEGQLSPDKFAEVVIGHTDG